MNAPASTYMMLGPPLMSTVMAGGAMCRRIGSSSKFTKVAPQRSIVAAQRASGGSPRASARRRIRTARSTLMLPDDVDRGRSAEQVHRDRDEDLVLVEAVLDDVGEDRVVLQVD